MSATGFVIPAVRPAEILHNVRKVGRFDWLGGYTHGSSGMPEPQLRILLTFHAPIDVTLTQRVLALCEELTGPARRLEVRDAGHGNFAVVGIDVPSVR